MFIHKLIHINIYIQYSTHLTPQLICSVRTMCMQFVSCAIQPASAVVAALYVATYRSDVVVVVVVFKYIISSFFQVSQKYIKLGACH